MAIENEVDQAVSQAIAQEAERPVYAPLADAVEVDPHEKNLDWPAPEGVVEPEPCGLSANQMIDDLVTQLNKCKAELTQLRFTYEGAVNTIRAHNEFRSSLAGVLMELIGPEIKRAVEDADREFIDSENFDRTVRSIVQNEIEERFNSGDFEEAVRDTVSNIDFQVEVSVARRY